MMEYDIQSNDQSDSIHSLSFKNSNDDQTWTLKLDPDDFNNQDSNNDEENDTFTEKFVKHLDKLKEERDGIHSPQDKKTSLLIRTNSSPLSHNNSKNFDKTRTKTPDVIMMKNDSNNDDSQYFDGNNNPTFPGHGDKTVLLPNIGALASTIGYENSTSDANNNDQNSIPAHYLIPCSSPGIPRSTVSINTSDSGLTTLSSLNQTNSLINPITESLVNMNTNNLNSYQTNQYSNLLVTDQNDANNRSNLNFNDNQNSNLIPATSVQLNSLLNLTGVIGSQNGQFNISQNQFSPSNLYRTSDANNNNTGNHSNLFPNINNQTSDTTVQLRLQGVSLTNGNQTTEMLFPPPPPNSVSNLNHIIVSSPSCINNQFLGGNNIGKIPDLLTLQQNQYAMQQHQQHQQQQQQNNPSNNLKHETIRVQMNSSPDSNSLKKPRISRTVLAAQVLMDQNPSPNNSIINNSSIRNKMNQKSAKEARNNKKTKNTPKNAAVKDVQVVVENANNNNTSNNNNNNNISNFSNHEYSNINTGSDSDDLSSYGCNLPPDADPSLIKLEKKRARNRVAARRCRERKLSLIQSLEAEVANLKHIMSSMREQKDRFIEVIATSVNQLNRLADNMPHLREEINQLPLMTSDSLKFNSLVDPLQQHQQQHNQRPPHTPNSNSIKRDLSRINSSFD